MGWLEVRIRGARDAAESFEALLEDAGAVSVTLADAEDQPLFEPGVGETPLWNHVTVTGLFPQGTDATLLQLQLAAAWGERPLPPLQFTELPEQDWVRAWLDDFKPMHFGARLWVSPEELRHDIPQADATVLLLDPGLAFGTGTHPTTALCLQWLDAQRLEDLTLVDFGCGSGILGLAALLLGAGTVHGVDNDPQALTATRENCRKNRIDPARFPLYMPDAWSRAVADGNITPVDGMLANILAGTLIELAAALSAQVKSGGWILLSGILREQADAVTAAYSPWFRDFAIAAEGDWVRISATRN